MPSPARGEEYAQSQAQVVTLALAELSAFWDSLDLTKPTAVKAVIAEFLATLVEAYGSISSTIAADFYDEMRAAAAPSSRFVALAGIYGGVEQITGSANWAVQPLFPSIEPLFETDADGVDIVVGEREVPPDPVAALDRLNGATQRLVQDQGRQTMVENVERDPARPRFARMPIGKTCQWCLMLASRGAVYATSESAGELNSWHDECDCQIIPSFTPDDLPYDPEVLLRQYLARLG